MVPANSTAMTASSVCAKLIGRPRPAEAIREPPSTKALMPPTAPKLSALEYAASHSTIEKPAVTAMIATIASAPSPSDPR